MNTTPTPQPNEVFATFCSGIDQASVQRIIQAFAQGSQNGVTHIHLLFQSNGGLVGDGICLYNFFRNAPIDLTLYNVGSVQSIGLIAYLGAKNRVAQRHCTFMMHRTTGPALQVGEKRLESFAKSVGMDDARTEAIIQERAAGTLAEWVKLRDNEFWLTADDAVKSGVADRIGDFAPPVGAKIYNF